MLFISPIETSQYPLHPESILLSIPPRNRQPIEKACTREKSNFIARWLIKYPNSLFPQHRGKFDKPSFNFRLDSKGGDFARKRRKISRFSGCTVSIVNIDSYREGRRSWSGKGGWEKGKRGERERQKEGRWAR